MANRKIQRGREVQDRCKRWSFLRPLHGTDMATLRSRALGELILGQRLLQAQLLQHFPKNSRR